jgi:alpha-beta hydrolase superfamily lysophospholipase
MRTPIIIAAAPAVALAAAPVARAAPVESTSATTTHHRVQVDSIEIFYREAGPQNAPTIVLLHGFPSSSREFDTLIPLLATRYHVLASDYPGFGQSDAQARHRAAGPISHAPKS